MGFSAEGGSAVAPSAPQAGGEPTIPFPVYHLSRVANSTTLAPLRKLDSKDAEGEGFEPSIA
jgi:hypothetical protein